MAQVKLILREDVPKLGLAGDVVSVKPGYARNFLLPKGKANVATESRVRELEHHKRVIAEEQAKLLKDLEAVRTKIESLSLEVEAQAGSEGKLFGSVTTQQVAELLAAQGIEIDRRKLQTDEPIKTVGEHVVSARLHAEMVAKVTVVVVASGAPEAPAPAEDEEPAPTFGGAERDDEEDEDDD